MIIDAWVCVESNRLRFQRMNQLKLRADLYSGLQDAMAGGVEDNVERLGRQVILASSFIGGPRHMRQQYQDAMAICRHFGKPDFFVTFTCNPQWQEIKEALYPGQKPEDAPHIVSRVFHLKLHSLLHALNERYVLGKVKAFVYVIEFQKRGLPHAHILLILDDNHKITSVADIDNCISAELPDQDVDPELYRIVKTNMIHGPCTPQRCQINGRCRKRYPRQWANETLWNEDGYPTYRRRDDGRTVQVRGQVFDNRSVVPYNPYLSKRYNAHINVEVYSRSFKYLYQRYAAVSEPLNTSTSMFIRVQIAQQSYWKRTTHRTPINRMALTVARATRFLSISTLDMLVPARQLGDYHSLRCMHESLQFVDYRFSGI